MFFVRKTPPVVFLLISLVLSFFCTQSHAAERKKVLVLHSYHKGLGWTDTITAGIEATLLNSPFPVDLHYEFMDTKRAFGKEHLANLVQLFENKYRDTTFDAIISSDDHAYQLLLKNHEMIFPQTPVSFCGVNAFKESDIVDNKWFTGVVEKLSVKETLAAALQLEPNISKVYGIMDDTVTGHSNRQQLEEAIQLFSGKLEVLFPEQATMEDVRQITSSLPQDTILLYLNFTTDAAHQHFSHEESAAAITASANRPMYTLWDFHLGSGAIGGRLTSGFAQGQAAAKLVIKVFQGVLPRDIPVVRTSPNHYLFDYRTMEKFGFHVKQLPPGSSVLYKPISFYQQYREIIWKFIAIVGVLLLVIVFISYNFLKLRLADKSLQQSELRFRQLTEMLPEAIYEADLEQRCIFMNRSGLEKFQIEKKDGPLCFPLQSLIVEKEFPKLHKRVQLLLQGQEVGIQEYKGIRRNGEEFPLIAHSSPIIEDGKVTGMRGVLIDVSEIQSLREQVYRAQKMESIGTLAGGIAHDFNNLLSGIQGHASLALHGVAPGSRLHDHLAGIEGCVRSASNLTKQLLGFARSGQYDLRLSDMNRLISKTIDMFSRTKKELQIHYDLEPNLWSVEVDRNQMEQVLLNLCINSWQAMLEDGTITVKTENVMTRASSERFASEEPVPHVRILVTDTGPGISDENREKIYDPFFSTKERGRGTGLGLASAYGIINNHKGSIRVVSKPQEGASFQIDLPAKKIQAAPDREYPMEIVTGVGTLFLVDDEQMVLEVFEAMLQELGYKVHVAMSGEEALDKFKSLKDDIDLVILDMIMPGMGGDEIFHALRSIDPQVKILLSSGYSSDERASGLIALGCSGFVQKPFDLSTISQKIQEIIHGNELIA